MGLLEKAYDFKKEINRKGRSTLIDTIKGPAETEMINNDQEAKSAHEYPEDIPGLPESRDDLDDTGGMDNLFELPEDDNYSPLDMLEKQKTEYSNEQEQSPDEKKADNRKPADTQFTTKSSMNPLTEEDNPILPDFSLQPKNDSENDEQIIKDGELSDASLQETGSLQEIEPDIISGDEDDLENPAITQPETDANPDGTNLAETDNLEDIIEESKNKEISNQYYTTLYELRKEISRSETEKELYETVIFSIMGQVGASAALIMKKDQEDNWQIAASSGLKSADTSVTFASSGGIIKHLKKDIVDIEKFKDSPEYTEQHSKFVSLKTRLLSPWNHKGKVIGVLALGDKITDEAYTDEEKTLVQALCEASAEELYKLNTIKNLENKILSLEYDLSYYRRINDLLEKASSSGSLKHVTETIKSEFKELGITGYSVFINDSNKEKYIPIITEDEDCILLKETGFSINERDPFLLFVKSRKTKPEIEDPGNSEIVKATFSETQINKMSQLWIFPFLTGDKLQGFTIIFRLKEIPSKDGTTKVGTSKDGTSKDDRQPDQDKKKAMQKNLGIFSDILFLNLMNIQQNDPEENRYIDKIQEIYNRINHALINSKSMNIPMTLVVFSIKNFKRYENTFGPDKSKELINNLAELIKSRISDTDFSARYDRNKILIALPGKDKKFATPLANTIRNDFMKEFKQSEMQLLITFLMSEFPEDGDDLTSLTDNLD